VAEAPIKVALSTELDSATKTVVLEEISSGDPFLFKDAEARLTPELHVLALILGLPVRPRNPVETFLAEISGESGPASTHSVGGLTSAFVSGGDEDLATALKYVSEADLRRVAALLAPTETGGLTTCYWLRSVSRIEDVYLFIRRAQLLIARGLDSVPTSGPAAKETSG
jgi:hypothetical protein